MISGRVNLVSDYFSVRCDIHMDVCGLVAYVVEPPSSGGSVAIDQVILAVGRACYD